MSVPGIGEKVAESICKYFSDDFNQKVLNGLLKEVTIITEQKSDSPQKLTGKIFVITGTLSTLSRDEAKDRIEASGGRVSGSVSKNTSHLLCGESAGSKFDDATKLGVPIIGEEEFLKMLR